MVAAKAKRFQDPARCDSVLKLWEALPLWEQLGSEVTRGGYPLPDWIKATSLEKLIPSDMLKTVIGRPELAGYGAKMAWVRAQMEHAKSQSRAEHYGDRGKTKDQQGDVDMVNNFEATSEDEDPTLANLQAECGRRAANGDWAGMEVLANAICALSKGRGKGKGGAPGFGKGQQSGFGGKGFGKGVCLRQGTGIREARAPRAQAEVNPQGKEEANSMEYAIFAASMAIGSAIARPSMQKWPGSGV